MADNIHSANSPTTPQPISPLRRRMIEDMTLRNLAPSTQQSYVQAVARFSRHFGRSSASDEAEARQLMMPDRRRECSTCLPPSPRGTVSLAAAIIDIGSVLMAATTSVEPRPSAQTQPLPVRSPERRVLSGPPQGTLRRYQSP